MSERGKREREREREREEGVGTGVYCINTMHFFSTPLAMDVGCGSSTQLISY